MRAVGEADRRRGAAHLLHRDHVREVAHRRAAVLLLDGDAEQAQVAHLAPEVGRKLVGAVDLGSARRDLVRGELPHGRAQHVDRVAVVEVDRGKVLHRHASRVKESAFASVVAVRMARPETVRYVYVNVNTSRFSDPRRRSRCRRRLQLQPPAAVALDERDLGQHRVDVLPLLVEHRAPVGEHLQELGELRPLVAGRRVDVEELADLGQREAEPLAAQDQLDPRALALAVDPRRARGGAARAGPRPRRSGSRASSARIPARGRKSSTWAPSARQRSAWRGPRGH